MRRWPLLALAVLLTGCPTREFYLQQSQVPWESQHIDSVSLPAFDAPPNAWVVADSAHRTIQDALSRGTVRVVDQGGQATLHGAVTDYVESSLPGAPRRVEDSSTSVGTPLVNYHWEMDVTHDVHLTLALRVLDAKGTVIWTKQSYGDATETETVTMDWPGSDPVAPPSVLPAAVDPAIYERLRDRALSQAISPLVDAITEHYAYKTL
ncbi:MAG TPA: hypothetical protein V6D47_10050 [Oscillatoriaceae cyanobacterium]